MQLTEVKLGVPAANMNAGDGVQVVAIASASHGSGKSEFAFNLAVSLAGIGQNAALFNADFLNTDIEQRFIEADEETLHGDPVGVYSSLKSEMVFPGSVSLVRKHTGYSILSEPDLLECVGLIRAFSAHEQNISHLVIDTSSNFSTCTATLCAAATQVIILVTGSPAGYPDCVALIKRLYHESRVRRFRVVASRVGSSGEGERVFKSVIALLEGSHDIVVTYEGFIPEDPSVCQPESTGDGLWVASPRSRASMAIRRMAENVCAWPLPKGPGGQIEFFVERLINHNNPELEVVS